MNIITDKLSLHCQHCQSKKLLSDGAVKTDDNRVYFIYICSDCGAGVPIDIEQTMAMLYDTNYVPSDGKVN